MFKANVQLLTLAALGGVLGWQVSTPAPATASGARRALQSVPRVDLKRYCGRWYEVARYENRYQDGLVAVTCDYSLNEDGTIRVVNTGREGGPGGDISVSTAKAWVEEGSAGAKWEVQFIWPFTADYWIIDLCDEYSYAVVGQPSRKFLWILSRKPALDEETFARICERLRENGYDPGRLQRTPHAAAAPS